MVQNYLKRIFDKSPTKSVGILSRTILHDGLLPYIFPFSKGDCWLFVEKRAVDLAMVTSEMFVICRQCWLFVEKIVGILSKTICRKGCCIC